MLQSRVMKHPPRSIEELPNGGMWEERFKIAKSTKRPSRQKLVLTPKYVVRLRATECCEFSTEGVEKHVNYAGDGTIFAQSDGNRGKRMLNVLRLFFDYTTSKDLVIRSPIIGATQRLSQLAIIGYIIMSRILRKVEQMMGEWPVPSREGLLSRDISRAKGTALFFRQDGLCTRLTATPLKKAFIMNQDR